MLSGNLPPSAGVVRHAILLEGPARSFKTHGEDVPQYEEVSSSLELPAALQVSYLCMSIIQVHNTDFVSFLIQYR